MGRSRGRVAQNQEVETKRELLALVFCSHQSFRFDRNFVQKQEAFRGLRSSEWERFSHIIWLPILPDI